MYDIRDWIVNNKNIKWSWAHNTSYGQTQPNRI